LSTDHGDEPGYQEVAAAQLGVEPDALLEEDGHAEI
jgi:hypothetical protein